MRIKKGVNTGQKLLMITLAVLLMAAAMPITASAAPMPSFGSLTIHKYALEDMDAAGLPNNGNPATNIPTGAVPLAGVEFTIWQVDPSAVPGVTTAADAWPHIMTNTEQMNITDQDGEIRFLSLPQGLYYVAETGNSGKTLFCEPFLVSVPMVDPATGDWITDVHAYPKNQTLAIDKFVAVTGTTDYYKVNMSLPVGVDEHFNWYIRTQLPVNIDTSRVEYYVINDTLSSYFEYQPGTVKLYIMPYSDSDLKDCTVLSSGDYYVNFDAATNKLSIGLTTTGITKVKDLVDHGSRYAVVEYGCLVNDSAPQGVTLYSGATLEYTRDAGIVSGASYNSDVKAPAITLLSTGDNAGIVPLANGNGTSNTLIATVAMQPGVHTGQIEITKLADGTKELLPGAKFGIAKTKSDAQAGNFIATGTTDSSGELTFSGLKYGQPGDKPSENTGNTTFWLVETKAPNGYQTVKDPVEVTFDYQQEEETGVYYFAKVNVYNVLNNTPETKGNPNVSPPGKTASPIKTGDTNSLYLFMAVMLLSLAAIVVVIVYRNKKKISGENK